MWLSLVEHLSGGLDVRPQAHYAVAMKTCTSCQTPKDESAFAQRGPGRFHTRCKECQNNYCRMRYAADPAKGAENRYHHKVQRRRSLQELVDALKDRPCTDCQQTYPPFVMEFDHRPGVGKVADISALVSTGRKAALLQEVTKCDVVCANCHRIRTFQRRNGV